MKDESYRMPIICEIINDKRFSSMGSKNAMTSPEYIAEQEANQLLLHILISSAAMVFSCRKEE